MKTAEEHAVEIWEGSELIGGFDSEQDMIPYIKAIQLDALQEAARVVEEMGGDNCDYHAGAIRKLANALTNGGTGK